jgi:glycosyltransferase involved in cell wall biosynthesis
MPLPVLFLIQHLGGGGTEHHLYDLITGVNRERIEPHVIHFAKKDGYVAGKLNALDWLPITYMPVTRAYDASGLGAAWRLRRYIRRHRIAVVVTFHFMADFLGTLAALGPGGPRVISSRRDMGFTRTTRQISLGRWMARGMDRLIAVSDAVRQAIARDEKIDPARIEVIYNGIDQETFGQERWDLPAERAALGIGPAELVIGCVASLSPVKCHLTLIDAFAQLLTLCPQLPLRLLLVGGGPMRSAIEARIAELGLGSKVILTGVSRAVAREIQLSDILVLASETEGFSNSLIQAMACRKPMIACRVGGNPEAITDGHDGLLVEPRDPAALAEAMARLACDPSLREQLGQAAYARVCTQFTRRLMLEKTEELILRAPSRR